MYILILFIGLYKSILVNTFVIYVPIHRRTILRTLNTWYEN